MSHTTTISRSFLRGSLFSLLLLTTACQTTGATDEVAVTTPLPEIAAPPTYADGYRISTTWNGEPSSNLLLSQTDMTETW